MFDSNRSTDEYVKLDEACELISQVTGTSISPASLLQAYGGYRLTVFWNFSRPSVKAEYTSAGMGESRDVILPRGLYALILLTEDRAEYGELAASSTTRPEHSFVEQSYTLDDLRFDEFEDFDELGTSIILRLPEQADEILAESWSLNPIGFRVADGYSPMWPRPEELLLSRSQIVHLIDTPDGMVAVKRRIAELDSAGARRDCSLYLGELAPHETIENMHERILSCINKTGKMFENAPSTYRGKCEPSLRDHILVTLSGALHGSVTGESENKNGRTDILVRFEGGNAFIGECKFWSGEGPYLEAIEQLFGYLGWRDNKAAVIVFVRNKNFESVIEKIKAYTPRHPNFSAFVMQRDETWWNYEFTAPDNPGRVVQLAVMAYHLPA